MVNRAIIWISEHAMHMHGNCEICPSFICCAGEPGLIFGWPKAISRRDFGLLQSLFPMTVIATAQSLREKRAVEGHIVISDFLANDMTVNGERQRHQEHSAVRWSHHQCLWESLWFLHKSLLFLYHKHTSSCWQRCHLLVNKCGEFIFIMDRYTSATV